MSHMQSFSLVPHPHFLKNLLCGCTKQPVIPQEENRRAPVCWRRQEKAPSPSQLWVLGGRTLKHQRENRAGLGNYWREVHSAKEMGVEWYPCAGRGCSVSHPNKVHLSNCCPQRQEHWRQLGEENRDPSDRQCDFCSYLILLILLSQVPFFSLKL